MNLYNWEATSGARRGKVKKTGTVVLHANDAVDLAFEALQKECPLSRDDHHSSDADANKERRKAPLMTAATAKALVKKMGFSSLLPCQAQCYRGIFHRRDVILHSRTGSGKTLAYALPIIERHTILETHAAAAATGPFLLIFVFSNELAVQTKGVLKRLYPKLHICVAGFEDLTTQRCDVVIGTVPALDAAIRGRKSDDVKQGVKRGRQHGGHAERDENEDASDDMEEEEEEEEEREEEVNEEEENEGNDAAEALVAGAVDASDVRAIVIDEVDLTLGPRFSNAGRRMRNLLKFIRKANGSLTEGLMTDFRSHHYVLCGATIPNWVLKAGFLGVKKYYYQLVTVGTAKLPEKLECFTMHCPYKSRVETAARLLAAERFGRTVVFGTRRQIERLEAELAAKPLDLSFRSLSPSKDELDRIAALEDFNGGAASVILCTDLAARGLDFVEVDVVLMLSLPVHNMAVETFVHRAGRTARASHSGRCLLLQDEREKDTLEAVRKNAHAVFKVYLPRGAAAQNAEAATSAEGKAKPRAAAAVAGTTPATVTFALTVRNPFRYTRPTAQVPSALEVLRKNMGDLFANASSVVEDAKRETVTFAYPADASHEVKQKLWKFALKEVTASQEV
ncbi:putative RNA helicase [Trypanosoma conorhini]|uniref:ATP-dependent RNA helicase n=1 Tax=Trypanosoma conorhini TaxID=83891 RepID=A0A3R7NEY0_9TRYP|nr:putative RNA helicase [Trypanosoma conorhini]RNF17629.1 putative RNA helicase [Trypanosoma conorhini]